MAKLSVIIATVNDSVATNLTMANIIYQLEEDKIDYEIILVDNNTQGQELANLQSFLRYNADRFPIHYHTYPISGTIPPHSYGVLQSTGDYVTMPDPHMVFTPHYFRTLVEVLEQRHDQNVEVIFTPFGVGAMGKPDGEYVSESDLVIRNPFGKAGRIGDSCKRTDPPKPILSNTLSSFISSREWFLHIGNMFPEAFEIAGGSCAESLLIGLTTWMFGKKCYLEPSIVAEHPVYREGHGPGRNMSTHLSMATGAYILGGEEYLQRMTAEFGEYAQGQFEQIRELCKDARSYVDANCKYSLTELVENWDKIKND